VAEKDWLGTCWREPPEKDRLLDTRQRDQQHTQFPGKALIPECKDKKSRQFICNSNKRNPLLKWQIGIPHDYVH
jgi:hypothetical protein